MTARDLQRQFTAETGWMPQNSQGEPDIDYVEWLEKKVLKKVPSKDEIRKVLYTTCKKEHTEDGLKTTWTFNDQAEAILKLLQP